MFSFKLNYWILEENCKIIAVIMRLGIISFIAVVTCFINFSCSSRVLELTDRFLDFRKDGLWFVMFYAPWCAYCKRLEPQWNHVAQSLFNTNIRVGKLDCTRFTSVATAIGISGYPTIIFFKGETQHIYNGDRIRDEMVNFALRMAGPPITTITRPESIANIKAVYNIFFVYVGEPNGQLWENYENVAEAFQAHAFFYSAIEDFTTLHVKLPTTPTVFVYKENQHYFFEGTELPEEEQNHELNKWVNEERFMTFPKVTRSNIHNILKTKKNLVLAIVEENKLEELAPEMLEFRDMVEAVVHTHRTRYHKHFQFGWVGSPELANSIAMTVLPLPHLIVVNSTTNHHHLPQDDPTQLTPQALVLFLDSVLNESAPILGGSSWWVRLYRAYFEAKTAFFDMWHGNPILTTVLFGLPMGFLSLICYSICCADIMDADDEEEEELLHEKHE